MRSGYLSDQENRAKMLQQVSVESAQSQDSRLCYLTSSEVIKYLLTFLKNYLKSSLIPNVSFAVEFQISDDDRMSLTTAVSDDDEIDENMQNSSYRAKQSATAASFNCTGAVRKAGFLSVKKWILRNKHQVSAVKKVKRHFII